jgi:large subunit ribosomal protein L17
MRHRAKGRQLSRTSEHKKALLRNMAASLFQHEKIVTTEAKAKELRPYAERLITLARRGDLHARRLVERRIQDREITGRLFTEIGPRFAARPGGYTRGEYSSYRTVPEVAFVAGSSGNEGDGVEIRTICAGLNAGETRVSSTS